MPKLALAVAAALHRIPAVRARVNIGSDVSDFEPLLYDSWRRGRVRVVVADAGYDSELTHRTARSDMNVRSVIPATIGRPSSGPPPERYRRQMHHRFKRSANSSLYRQRSHSEMVNSMMKRNYGSALRARTPERREREMLLKAMTHNIAI